MVGLYTSSSDEIEFGLYSTASESERKTDKHHFSKSNEPKFPFDQSDFEIE